MRIFSSKRRTGFIGLVLATGIALAAVVSAAVTWGPSRPTFTWHQPATGIHFNSITDNPLWGDERYVVKARDINAGTNTYSTSVQVQDNQEFLVTTYFHNNAASDLNLVATNTRVKVQLPTTTATTGELKSFISADNATPTEVWSTMDFKGSQPFSLEYEPGSAKLITNNVNTSLSDAVVNGGVLVGTNGPDGKVPGCAEFSGYVTIRVRIHIQKPKPVFACTNLDVNKISRTRFDFTAHGSATNATIQSYTFTAKDSNGSVVDTKTVNTSATSANYTFERDVPGNYTVNAVVNTDQGSDGGNCVKQITVENKPTTPVFECTNLTLTKGDNRSVSAKVTYNADGGATFKSASFDFGDGSSVVNTGQTTATHTYAKDGTYTVNTTLTFSVTQGNVTSDKTAKCSASVTFTTPPIPTPTPTPPSTPQVGKEIPNTGPGSVAGIFAGVSALAGAGHFVVTRRVRG